MATQGLVASSWTIIEPRYLGTLLTLQSFHHTVLSNNHNWRAIDILKKKKFFKHLQPEIWVNFIPSKFVLMDIESSFLAHILNMCWLKLSQRMVYKPPIWESSQEFRSMNCFSALPERILSTSLEEQLLKQRLKNCLLSLIYPLTNNFSLKLMYSSSSFTFVRLKYIPKFWNVKHEKIVLRNMPPKGRIG